MCKHEEYSHARIDFCVVFMDKLEQLANSDADLLYYRGVLATPPLRIVDDVLGVQNCFNMSKRLNKIINTFIELENLTVPRKKFNVQIGKSDFNCPELKVTWSATNEKVKAGNILGGQGFN